jgi:two-component system NtrC family sensor kinase
MADFTRNYRIRVRLLLVVSLLVTLVLASGASAVFTALTSRQAILRAHEMEVASRRAAQLGVFAREQYIHEVHTIIVRDHSHVEHHDVWVDKLGDELPELRAIVDDAGAKRLDAIAHASDDLKRAFSKEILPAIDRHDWADVRRSHDRANVLVDRMTEHADALARFFDAEAVHAEDDAADTVRLALVLAIATGVLAGGIALFSGQRLWRSFSRPLASLEGVAQRVTEGDRTARVEPIAAREFAVVARTFNRMLDALSSAEAKLVATERLAAIGRIAAGIAHEINNPIAVIRGYLAPMREEAHSDELREELRILDEEAALCQRIAEELLVYARTPALSPRPVDMAELLRDASERAEGIPLRRHRAGGTPSVIVDADPIEAWVDPLRIRQVVVNLVANAREATADSTPVAVRGRAHERGYRIEVLDRGEGIPADIIEHIFEPFFTTKRNGTGLGLAVCYGLTTAHGGRIHAEPREGAGMRFVVELPISAAPEEQKEAT